ncbi:MAG: hypothetical protein J7527_03160 [Chitinophagaceae bacterium]|nr:hypothetical protein [Chitinophagaceae bacterium]
MGLFNFLKKSSHSSSQYSITPYKDDSLNLIYNLLFCDDFNLYADQTEKPYTYPFDVLLSEQNSAIDLQKIADSTDMDPRVRILAYNKLVAGGHKPAQKELLSVIVEVGLNEGLDVLASFSDGTARYINHSEKILIWETRDDENANRLTKELFDAGKEIVNQIGPWDKPRRPAPAKRNVRITFLVSDGLYFGEGPMNVLFNDPMAAPALTKATELMQYLTRRSLEHGG